MATDQQRPRRKNNTSNAARDAYKKRAYDSITVRIKSGERAKLQNYVADHGTTVNALIIAAINTYCGDVLTPLQTNPYI